MQAFIGATLLNSKLAQPQSKPLEISDSRLTGFILRVQPSGVRTYYARFGRNRRVVLGTVDILSPEEARERCRKVLGNVVHGNHPLHGIRGSEGMTLGMFVADAYSTWINASRPRLMKKSREAANVRHLKRGEPLLPLLNNFGDHLTPAVLLSINTGLRRGELFKLQWSSVDFDRQLVTVEGRNAKSRQTRHVPLNDEATSLLRSWREQTADGARMFAVATNYKNGWKALLKRAGIKNFRWHDMRHHFASRLSSTACLSTPCATC
jgi:hypothetical protein